MIQTHPITINYEKNIKTIITKNIFRLTQDIPGQTEHPIPVQIGQF